MSLAAAASVPVGAAVLAGGPVASALAVLGLLVWGMWRWPRWEARMFGHSTSVERHVAVWVPPHDPRAGDVGLGPEGHRAFAQALHSVAQAYLAECEREAGR
jgi:hypothetical protein